MPKRQPQLREEPERVEKVGRVDRPMLLLILLLLAVGLIALFTASYANAYRYEGDALAFIRSQANFAFWGVVAMLAITTIDHHKLHYLAIPAFLFVVVLMLTIKIPGLKNLWVTINDATRWINIPGLGSFQPSELAKPAVILCFSSLATIFGPKKMHTLRWGIIPFMGMLGVIALELTWQKHLSGTVIIAAIGMAIMFFAGANLFWFGLGGVGAAGVVVWYIATRSYAMTRIKVWLDPFIDPLDKGYQGVQSLLAIGSGGFWGLGLGQGRQKHLYLPEPANDFVFSVWCEEMGFVGAAIVVILFAMLVWRGYYIALHTSDKFGTLLAAGITTQFAIQAFMNFGVVTGLLPVTGASLPFFSYGGTALLIQLAEMGILLEVSKHMPVSTE